VYDVSQQREITRLSRTATVHLWDAARNQAEARRGAYRSVRAVPDHAVAGWRMTLDDPSTGMHVAVSSFGPTQVASFQQLFQ
jgi:hypothetical protein